MLLQQILLFSSIVKVPSESTYEQISGNGLEEPFAGKCDNYNRNYSRKYTCKVVQTCNYHFPSSPGYLDEGRRNHHNHNLLLTCNFY